MYGVVEAQSGLVMQQLLRQRADGQCFTLNAQVYIPGRHQEEKKIHSGVASYIQ